MDLGAVPFADSAQPFNFGNNVRRSEEDFLLFFGEVLMKILVKNRNRKYFP